MNRALVALFVTFTASTVQAASDEIAARLASISAASGGTMGVSALNLKTGERVRLNADQPFPMASTFKIPVAIKVLEQVERGAFGLDDKLPIDPNNVSPGSGELVTAADRAPKSETVGELVKLMMRNSDNTATDYLLARVGGAKTVTAHVKGMRIDGLTIDRPAGQLVADAWGFKLPPVDSRTPQNLRRAQGAVSAEKRAAAAQAFLQDPRDTSTPDAMVELLEQLQRGKALGKRGTEFLLDQMENCRTGPKRLKGEMPRGVPVAHKTGTLTRIATNDVGIVPLGWSNGPMVIAVYLKGSPQPLAAQERAIADAAIAVYNHFSR